MQTRDLNQDLNMMMDHNQIILWKHFDSDELLMEAASLVFCQSTHLAPPQPIW